MPRSSAARDDLVGRDKDFALALIEHKFNGTQAAIAVGVSERSASTIASRMLAKVEVQQFLSEALEQIRQHQQLSIQDMYEEWRRIAFANMDDYTYQNDDGETIINLPHGNRALMAAVKKVRTVETRRESADGESELVTHRVEIELHDKTFGMEKLSRLFGMFDGKDPNVTVINGNVQYNDNRKVVNNTVVIATVEEGEGEYAKLIGR